MDLGRRGQWRGGGGQVVNLTSIFPKKRKRKKREEEKVEEGERGGLTARW